MVCTEHSIIDSNHDKLAADANRNYLAWNFNVNHAAALQSNIPRMLCVAYETIAL